MLGKGLAHSRYSQDVSYDYYFYFIGNFPKTLFVIIIESKEVAKNSIKRSYVPYDSPTFSNYYTGKYVWYHITIAQYQTQETDIGTMCV